MEGCLLLVENESSLVYNWMLILATELNWLVYEDDGIQLMGSQSQEHHGPKKEAVGEPDTQNKIADENKAEAIFRCYLKTLGWPLDENRPSWSISSYFRRKPKVFVRPNDADEDDADAFRLKILSRRIFYKIVDSRICLWSDESSHCQVVERNRWRFEFF